MPPLKHWDREAGDFDMRKSEVVQWLLAQDFTIQWLFEKARATKRIWFDAESGTWRGRRLPGAEEVVTEDLDEAGTEDSL